MSIDLNLKWWAQLAIIVLAAFGLFADRIGWSGRGQNPPPAATAERQPRPTNAPPASPDGWQPTAVTWAEPAAGR
jgi:hypothetical protein